MKIANYGKFDEPAKDNQIRLEKKEQQLE